MSGYRLNDEQDIVRFIEAQPAMMRVLQAAEALALPDAWIGAGFVRNAVWDALAGTPGNHCSGDIDLVFFDPADTSAERDRSLETALRLSCPDALWSVKNQARMHRRNGDAPYANTADALAHWPETATAVAARSERGNVILLAPYGVADLLALVVRPTPPFALKMNVYRQRIVTKAWPRRWPSLTVLDAQ